MRQQYFAPGIFPEDIPWGVKPIHPVSSIASHDGREWAPPADPLVRAAGEQAEMKPKPKRATRSAGSKRNRRANPSAARFKRGVMWSGEPIVLVVKYRRDGPWAQGTPQE